MDKFNYMYDSNIILDKCKTCNGLWADGGELIKLAIYTKGNPILNSLGNALVGINILKEKKKLQRKILNRSLSAFVATLYLVITAYNAESNQTLRSICFLVVPIACIWYGDVLGSITGIRFGRIFGPVVTKESPGFLVCLLGWVMLLLPIIYTVINQ